MQLQSLARRSSTHHSAQNEGKEERRGSRRSRRAKEHHEPDYSAGKGRRSRRYSSSRSVAYSLKIEPQVPQKRPSFISRTADGKFVLTGSFEDNGNDADDEGGFGVNLPPNRFRTRSVAIVAGYSPERLYSNVPPGAFVVESGVYKVGADREWERPEPIYWKQVVYGGENDGTIKKRIPPLPNQSSSMSNDFKVNSHLNEDLELPKDQNYNHLRASSPLEQGRLSVEYLSPMNFSSELSSVRQPSSAEKSSLPSTINPNSISNTTGSSYPTTLTLESDMTPRSRFTTSSSKSQTELETIHEDYSTSSEYLVKADIHINKENEDVVSGRQVPEPQIPSATTVIVDEEDSNNYENAPGVVVPLATSSPPRIDHEYENMAIVRLSTKDDDEEVRAITSSSSTSSPTQLSPKNINNNLDLRNIDHFYENWPPIIPPLTYHATPADATSSFSSNSSLPPEPRSNVATAAASSSRPSSCHSAPLLDLSIDRHYEFDSGGRLFQESPCLDDLSLLPRRPYHGYNPRRDRPELGSLASAENENRVFSDSEIYSPVFPRGRPPSEASASAVSERVKAMKIRFEDYRRSIVKSETPSEIFPSPKSSKSKSTSNKTLTDSNRLESLI